MNAGTGSTYLGDDRRAGLFFPPSKETVTAILNDDQRCSTLWHLEDTPNMCQVSGLQSTSSGVCTYVGNATPPRSHWVDDYQKEISVFSKFP